MSCIDSCQLKEGLGTLTQDKENYGDKTMTPNTLLRLWTAIKIRDTMDFYLMPLLISGGGKMIQFLSNLADNYLRCLITPDAPDAERDTLLTNCLPHFCSC